MSEIGCHITLHIGRVLNPKDLGQWDDFFPGFLAVDGDGRIVGCGEWNQEARNRFGDAGILDHGGCVISPGFVDVHLHLPQLDARGMAGATLLEWLERYIYPAEMAFADPSRARETGELLWPPLWGECVCTIAVEIRLSGGTKKCWQSLERGDYEWSHTAMNYWPERVKEKCMTNKSYAIAHGLE